MPFHGRQMAVPGAASRLGNDVICPLANQICCTPSMPRRACQLFRWVREMVPVAVADRSLCSEAGVANMAFCADIRGPLATGLVGRLDGRLKAQQSGCWPWMGRSVSIPRRLDVSCTFKVVCGKNANQWPPLKKLCGAGLGGRFGGLPSHAKPDRRGDQELNPTAARCLMPLAFSQHFLQVTASITQALDSAPWNRPRQRANRYHHDRAGMGKGLPQHRDVETERRTPSSLATGSACCHRQHLPGLSFLRCPWYLTAPAPRCPRSDSR